MQRHRLTVTSARQWLLCTLLQQQIAEMEQGLCAKTDEAKTLKAQKDELVANTEQLQESLTETQTTLDTTQVSYSNESVLLTAVWLSYTHHWYCQLLLAR
jgi:septal ring factor EnvC (AmiA/AmiB activator)